MSYQIRIDPRSRKAGRFISSVHSALLKAFFESGKTQQELATKLDVDRSTINKRVLGKTNLTLRTISDLAWAMEKDISFKLVDPLAGCHNGFVSTSTDESPKSTNAPIVTETIRADNGEFIEAST